MLHTWLLYSGSTGVQVEAGPAASTCTSHVRIRKGRPAIDDLAFNFFKKLFMSSIWSFSVQNNRYTSGMFAHVWLLLAPPSPQLLASHSLIPDVLSTSHCSLPAFTSHVHLPTPSTKHPHRPFLVSSPLFMLLLITPYTHTHQLEARICMQIKSMQHSSF